MALREIRVRGDEVLNKKCKEVKEMTDRLSTLIDDMIDTMHDADGVGLAAPQVGILKRLCVIDISEDGNDPIVLINPEIIEKRGEQKGTEGCLSVPGMIGFVTRPDYVKVRACDRDMNVFEMEGEGLLARAFCHEIEHLDGNLYVDLVEGPLMTQEEFREKYYGSEDDEEEEE